MGNGSTGDIIDSAERIIPYGFQVDHTTGFGFTVIPDHGYCPFRIPNTKIIDQYTGHHIVLTNGLNFIKISGLDDYR